MYFFVDNVNVTKAKFDRFKNYHTKYDLVIDTKTNDAAIFTSTNTDFVFHTTKLYDNYKLNYEITCFNCNHCVDCIMCNKCENSKYLNYCFNCINCENCSYSNDCKQVTNGKYMNNCVNSSVLYMCKEVVDSNNIDYCNLIDKSYNTSFSNTSKYIRSSTHIVESEYITDSDYVQDSMFVGASKFIQACEIVSNCYIACYSQVVYNSSNIDECSFIAHSKHCSEVDLMKTSVNTDKKIEEIKQKIVNDINKYGVTYMYGCIDNNIPYDHRLRMCIDKSVYDKNEDIAKKIDKLKMNDYIDFCNECTNVYNCERCININDSKFMKNYEGDCVNLLTQDKSIENICLNDNTRVKSNTIKRDKTDSITIVGIKNLSSSKKSKTN